MTDTLLDQAYQAHIADPEDTRAHARFLERIMDAELFLLLAAEPEEGRVQPDIFDLSDGRFVLAFDLDSRLAEFLETPAPYIALSGRNLVEMLAGQEIGIALNPGVAVSETLLTPDMVLHLAQRGAATPQYAQKALRRIGPPKDLPPDLLSALEPKLCAMADVISAAYLVEAVFEDESEGILLALFGVTENIQPAIAVALAEAARFAELRLDVTFLASDAAQRPKIETLGVRIELPQPSRRSFVRSAPGSDPDKPPILK